MLLAAFVLDAALSLAQPIQLPAPAEVVKLCERVTQLIDSTRLASPELGRAGEPLSENARQLLANLRGAGTRNSPQVYAFLSNLRGYVALADAIPKPATLSEEARRQFSELREAQDRLEAYLRALLELKEQQLRDPDRDALARYAEANRKLPPPEAGVPRVVFLGDSITDLWPLNEYFPPERDFVNRGISGQITGQMLGRMLADVVRLKPAAVVVLGGTNDIARGVEVETIKNNLTMIAQLAEANKIVPLFASLLPVSDYHKDKDPSYERTVARPPELIRSINQWLENFCREHNYVYVDYYSALADARGMLAADLSDDGLHPNSKGYRLMAPLVQAAIDKAVRPPAPQRKRNPIWRMLGGDSPRQD